MSEEAKNQLKETDFGMVSSDWNFIPANVYCSKVTDGTHDSPKEKKSGKHLVTSKHIRGRNINFDNAYLISEDDFNKINQRSKVDQWDVIISMIGEYCGFCYVERNEFIDYAVKNVGLFKTGSKAKAMWLYYFLNSKIGFHILDSNKSGTSQPYLTLGFLRELPVLYPNNDNVANTIVEILSSLDDKIDLLHRQNKTMEQMAETLFRQWFIEDINGNELVLLDEYADTINGISYKSSELNTSTTAMVSLKCFDRTGRFNIDGFKEFTGKFKERQVVIEGDLIVAHTDITQEAEVIGNPALVIGSKKYDTLVISMDMVKVIPKVDWISIEFLYFLMKTREFKGHCEGHANGSTVLHLSKQAIPTFELSRPEKDKVIEFTNQSKEIVKKIFSNHKQITNLTQLRDTLLPKLMSGEIKVKDM